jgi:hypothetical protein
MPFLRILEFHGTTDLNEARYAFRLDKTDSPAEFTVTNAQLEAALPRLGAEQANSLSDLYRSPLP